MNKWILNIFVLIIFISCKEKNEVVVKTNIEKYSFGIKMDHDSILPPNIVKAGIPKNTIVNQKKSLETVTSFLPPNAHFTNFNTEQGLALSTINCGYYDKLGNLWFGTGGGGVSKYDGKKFTSYTTVHGLSNNMILCITEDLKGNMWFGTSGGGVSCYDGKSFKNYNEKNGLGNNVVYDIEIDKIGDLWIATYGGGISKFDGKKFTNYTKKDALPNDIIVSISKGSNGKLWIGTNSGGVSIYNGKTFENFKAIPTLTNSAVLCVKEDRLGNVWIGTKGGGVYCYNGKTYINYSDVNGVIDNTINCITEDRNGNIWFGTKNSGAFKYNGNKFINYSTANGLTNNNINSITEDKDGNLWLGTLGGGINRFDGENCMSFTTKQGLSDNNILSINEDKNKNLWFGTNSKGISKYDGNKFENYNEEDGLGANTVFGSTEDKNGNICFATAGGGLSIFDSKKFMNFSTNEGLSEYLLLSITKDKKENLWLGTSGSGVFYFDGEKFTNYTTKQGLAYDVVFNIKEDKQGNVWFATYGGGVSKFDGKYFTNYTTTDGLSSNMVFTSTIDNKGNLWFGTEDGLSCFKMDGSKKTKDGKESIQIINYSIANGLPDNFITQVLQLSNGKIAVGTNKGIAVFNSSLPLNSTNQLAELEVFNPSTGYSIKDVNVGQNCMIEDSKGMIWAGIGDQEIGLVKFNYKSVNHNLKPPTVVIQNVKINEENVCYYVLDSKTDSLTLSQQEILTYNKVLSINEKDSLRKKYKGIKFDDIANFYSVPENLKLPYEHNNITFEFNCIEVGKHYMVNYQYRLEGYDKDWSPVLSKEEARYGNINEGSYIFKLRAKSPEGVWCEPINYAFIVLPPWYRTWQAYLLYSIGILSFLVLIFKWRVANLKNHQKILEKKIEDATEDIKQKKNVIEEKHKEITDSINYAERIQRSLLASKKMLDENLNDYFILFKPKDIVSGDFYWATKTIDSNGTENFVLVTADSTGHGVPGAIMSILNMACLDKSVTKGIVSPDLILNETRKLVIEHLKNDGSPEGGKDGMDGSLLSFDFKNNMLTCASANNSIWIIREKELIEIKADRMPIGKHDNDSIPFRLHSINLQKDDVVYTLTDGFPDQFGGGSGKKFKSKQLQDILISISHEPMKIQKQKLADIFDSWKGNLEQVDDVCIIGIKL